MSTTATGARRSGPWFGLAFVLACTLLVFFGFSFTFLGRVVEQLRPLILYAHVATAASWLLLLVAQAALARSRKLALHRRLGKYGFILGVLAAAVLTLPAVARIPVIGGHGIWALAPTAALLLILCAVDLWRDRRLHKVYLVGVPAYIGLTFTCVLLATSAPTWWVKTAAWLCHVPVA